MQNEISRQIDELGRLVIPAELRRAYGLKPGDAVFLTALADGIIIKIKEREADDGNGKV